MNPVPNTRPRVGYVAQCLEAALEDRPAGLFAPGARLLIGLSGGADSVALLLAAHALREGSAGALLLDVPVEAVHINHALQEDAIEWQRTCESLCAGLGVVLHVRVVEARALAGEGPEAAARKARHDAFASLMRPGDILATAHQRDDQAETVMLALLRGSGPRGLAGMATWQRFSSGWLFRPLLSAPAAALADAVAEVGVKPVVDPSNADPRYKRSGLRLNVFPALEACSPGATATIARAARHQAETAAMLDDLARMDCGYTVASSGAQVPNLLPASMLAALGAVRARNALRVWLEDLGLPVPSASVFDAMIAQVVDAKTDACPLVSWPGGEMRRHRDQVWAGLPLPAHDPRARLEWPGAGDGVPLDVGVGTVRLEVVDGARAGETALLGTERVRAASVQVGFRAGGERCRPSGSTHRRPLKDLLRERAVAPWMRERLPLLYLDGELACVGDLWICHGFEAPKGRAGLAVRWHPASPQGSR